MKRERRHSIAKTRKEHRCYHCGDVILKGSSCQTKKLFTGKTAYFHWVCPYEMRNDDL